MSQFEPSEPSKFTTFEAEADKSPLQVEKRDIIAVCVFPDGRKRLLVRQPLWLTLYFFAAAIFLIGLALLAEPWRWSNLLLFGVGAGTGAMLITLFPRSIMNDPAKPHHWG